MGKMEEIRQNLSMELRRGVLVICVLGQLRQPHYGYSLIQRLAEQGLEIDQNTLYPLLRRLEKQGLLDSNWSVDEARPRRYYILNSRGGEVFNGLVEEWLGLHRTVAAMLKLNGGNDCLDKLD